MCAVRVHRDAEDGGAHQLPRHPPPLHVRAHPHRQHIPHQLQQRGALLSKPMIKRIASLNRRYDME
jgi:hypothetical protein